MKKRLLALTLSGLMLISSISPANIQAYASEPSDAFSTISGNDLPANQNEETGEESEETQESTETTNLDLNDFFDWDLSNSGFADISGNDAFLLASLVETPGVDVLKTKPEQFTKLNTKVTYTSGGSAHEMTETGGKYELPAEVLPSEVDKFRIEVELAVTDTNRNLNAGDYFEFILPEGLNIQGAPAPVECKIDSDGTVWANTTVTGKTIQFVFTDAVEKKTEGILTYRGMKATMSFDFNIANLKDGQGADFDIKWSKGDIHLSVPKGADDITGIKKTGEFDKAEGLIHWTVEVGEAKDKTVSLKDYTFTDTFGENQSLVNDSIKVGGTTKSVKTTGSTFQFTFDDVKAPQTVEYDTQPEAKFMMGNVKNVSNTATVSSKPVKGEADGKDFTDTFAVTAPEKIIVKNGIQVSSDEMEWTISYNKEGVKVWKATVFDDLSAGLTYVENSALFDGNPAPSGVTVSTSELDTNRQKLSIKFDTVAAASGSYDITFRTKIDPSKFSGEGSATKIENVAYVSAEFPSGSGTGPATEYSAPKVETDYSAAFIDKSVVDTDEAKARRNEGYITWEIHPSTKKQDSKFYKNAVVTDTLPSDQAWMPDRVNIKAKDYDLVTNGVVAASVGGQDNPCTGIDSSAHTFTFDYDKLHALGLELGDVYITLETKALNYLSEDKEHTYKNEASLSLKMGDAVVAKAADNDAITFGNKMLSKDVKFVSVLDPKQEPSATNRSYFIYTMKVNENRMSLTNAVLTDDISHAFAAYKADDTKVADLEPTDFAIDADKSKVEKVAADGTKTPVATGSLKYEPQKLTFNMGTTSDSYLVTLYVYMTDTEPDKGRAKMTGTLADTIIRTQNQAELTADELGTFKSNVAGGKGPDKELNNTILAKYGIQKGRSINWTVRVNLGGAGLGATTTFTDKIPSGLYLDGDSVKVLAPTYAANKGNVPDEPGESAANLIGTDGITKSISRSKEGTAVLTVNLPADTARTYLITYTTDGVSDETVFRNEAMLDGTNIQRNTFAEVAIDGDAWSSGYAVAVLKMTKADALSCDSTVIPLAGAEYVLLNADGQAAVDDAGNIKEDCIVDIKETDAKGNALFVAKLNQNYYIAEKTAPEGYVRDTNVYGPFKATKVGLQKVGPEGLGEGYFKDVRENNDSLVADLHVTKTFDTDTTGDFRQKNGLEKTAAFTLYIYPDKGVNANSTYKRAVAFTKAGGSYKYADQNGADANYTKLTATDSTATGSTAAVLKLTDLPWGHYELVETKAAAGYLPTAKLVFEVDKTGKLSFTASACVDAEDLQESTVAAGDQEKVAATATLKNHRTQLVLKKTDMDGNVITSMESAEFTLTPAETTDALVEAEVVAGSTDTAADTTKKLTFTGQQLSDGVTLSGLCQVGVKYTLTDTKAPKGYQTMKPVTFMINDGTGKEALGTIAIVGGTTDTVAVTNPAAGDATKTATITLKNKPTAFDFVKVDQNGLGVANVVLTIAPEVGSSFAHAAGTGAVNDDGNIILTTAVDNEGAPKSNTITGEMVAGNTYIIKESYGPGFAVDADRKAVEYMHAADKTTAFTVSEDGTGFAEGTLDSSIKEGNTVIFGASYTNAAKAGENSKVTITNHRVLAQMAITKVDADDTTKKLGDAEFKLYRQAGTTPNPDSATTTVEAGKDTLLTTIKTAAEDGTWKTVNAAATVENSVYGNINLSLGLPVGTYYLVETKAPQGYQIATGTYSFAVTRADDGKTIDSFATTKSQTVNQIADKRIPGSIVLTKQDANDGSKLAGAVFALYVKNGTVLTPATISTGTTAEVDGKTVPTVTTAADGKATFTDLAWGTYVVKELTASAGYELNPLESDGTALKEITIDATTASTTEEKNEVTKTITDSKTSFKLRKIDQNGMPVVGANLTLVEEKDAKGTATGAQVGVYTTNGTDVELNGVLKAGYSYSLTEESAAGFFVTSGKTHFTVSADGTKLENLKEDSEARYVNLSVKLADTDKTVELTNTRYLEGLEVTKVDKDTQSALAGAQFVLYQQKESTADPDTDIKVVVDATGSAVDANRKPYVLTADANGKINLKDAAYADKKNGAIRDNSGNLIKDKDGNLQPLSEGLGTGNYYLIETKAPEGYTLDTNVKYAFNITQKEQENQVTTIKVENNRILGTLTFTSKDEKTDEAVPGVVYGLYEKSGSTWISSTFPTGSTVTVEGKTVPTITTNASGNGKIEKLPWGKEYALMEIQDSSLQPQGYVLNPAVTAEGKDKDHSDYPTPILFGTPAVTGKTNTVLHVHSDLYIQPIILDIHKVGPQNEPLAGAKVKVTGSFADGTTEKTFTTEVDDEEPNGTETWNKLLKPGETYHVTEVTPAPTYGSTTDFDFVVGTDGFVTVVTDGLDAGIKEKLQKETSYGKVEDTHARHSQITVKSPQTILNFSTDVNRYEQGLQTAMQKPSTLAGIKYQVYSDEAGTKVQKDGHDVTASSDKDGKVVIPGLPAGTYYIKEIGYDTLTASAIGKPDATSEELTLAQARLWGTKLTNKVYRGDVTNSDFGGIEVKEGDTWKAVEHGIIHHEVYSGEIKFTKVDKDDNSVKLADSTYGLYRSLDSYPEAIKAQAEALIAQKKLATYAYQNKTYVLLDKQVTSSEAGKEGDIVFQVPLAAEEYLIKELQAPAGHKVSADPVLVSMHLSEAPDVDGAATITTSLKSNGNGTMTTGANGLTWFEPRIKLQVKTLSNASPETAVGPVHLVLKDKDGNIVDEWDTTIEEYEEDGLVDKEVDVPDVDDEGNPVLDAEGKQTTHKEVQQVPGKVKKQRVLDWNHTVVDTASLLKVGETYTITTTSVPAGFVPNTVSFKVNTVEVPAYTGNEFPTEFIQVEKIVIGKKAAPTQRNTSSNGNGGNSKPQNPTKDTVSPEKTAKDPIVVIQDSASLIEKSFTSNGKDGKGSLFGKSRKGTSVATAGSRKENGVVRSVRRALEAAFGAISGSYRKLVTKTGDEAPIIGMIALLLIAVVGIITVMIHKRKKK